MGWQWLCRFKWIGGDFMVMFAKKEDAQNRIAICNGCEKKSSLLCTECNCLVTAKVRLNYASCPLGKWDQVDATLDQPWDVEDLINKTVG